MDIEESAFNREFDVLFICGVFNLRIAGIEESMKSILKKLITICKGDLHLNVLSYKTAHRDVELFYVKPEELLRFAKAELSPDTVLRDDIIEGDIFLSVFR